MFIIVSTKMGRHKKEIKKYVELRFRKDKIVLYKKEYNRERMKNDPVYKMARKIGNLIGLTFKKKVLLKNTSQIKNSNLI